MTPNPTCRTRKQLRMILDPPPAPPPRPHDPRQRIRARVLGRLRAAHPWPVHLSHLTRDCGVLLGMVQEGLIECLDWDLFRLSRKGSRP